MLPRRFLSSCPFSQSTTTKLMNSEHQCDLERSCSVVKKKTAAPTILHLGCCKYLHINDNYENASRGVIAGVDENKKYIEQNYERRSIIVPRLQYTHHHCIWWYLQNSRCLGEFFFTAECCHSRLIHYHFSKEQGNLFTCGKHDWKFTYMFCMYEFCDGKA